MNFHLKMEVKPYLSISKLIIQKEY